MNESPIRTIRASQTPLAMDCPASIYGQNDPILINPNDMAGSLGTCAHDVLGDYILSKEQPLEHYMAKRAIPEKHTTELQIMTAIGKIFWNDYGHLFPDPQVELSYETATDGVLHTGHTDVTSFDGELIHILDWKSTRLEGCNYMPQMMRYLWLAMTADDNAIRFKYTICFLRDKTIESSIEFTQEDLDSFHAEFTERVLNWDGKTYCPGGNCTYCPRIATCVAHLAMVQNTQQIFSQCDPIEAIEQMIATIPEEEVVSLYQKIKYCEGFLAKARNSIRLRTQTADNRLSGDGGKDLILLEQKKTTIDTMKAWPFMQEKLSDAEINQCVKVSKTPLLDLVKATATRGQKKKVAELFMAQLEEAGALSFKPYFVQALVRHIPQIESTVIDNEAE